VRNTTVDDTTHSFGEMYPFAKRRLSDPEKTVVRTEAATDAEIFWEVMKGLANRPCILELNARGIPTGTYVVPTIAERQAIAHYLLPATRKLVTGHEGDPMNFTCGGVCGRKECMR
jgi:hypothetical protein